MIIEKEVEVKLSNTNKTYFKNLGYDINNKYIIVKVEHLSKGSKTLITAKCDICDNIKTLNYKTYIYNTENQKIYTCSSKCSRIKVKNTCLEKYGVENPSQVKEINDKRNNTFLEKYGEHPLKNKDVRNKIVETNKERYGTEWATQSDIIKEKTKNTCLEKYGVEYIFQDVEIKEIIRKTMIDKYGVNYALQNDIIRKKWETTNLKMYGFKTPLQDKSVSIKSHNTLLNNWGVSHISKSELIKDIKKNKRYILEKNNTCLTISKYSKLIGDKFKILNYKDKIFNILDLRDNTEFRISLRILRDRLKWNKTEISTLLNPIGSKCTSGLEINLKNWLLSLNILFNENNRNIIFPKELDIYIPSLNLAIEFNGLYWHSEDFIDKNYHLDKSLKCQEKGIHLLHIFEDDWIFKQDIIKSIILNKLNINLCKIYARQCEIRVIEDSKLIREFLDKNHIQGYSQSSIKLGLYYNNELVSLMTFGYRHTNSKKEFELIRFCNKINLNVIGAASKLFNYFKKNYQFTDLISYSDFSLFDGKLYQTLGFTKQHLSKPNYFWVVDGIRYHRFNFNKQKLIKEGVRYLCT
jgi:hypothetical protein